MVDTLQKYDVPGTPAGGLGCHIDAKAFYLILNNQYLAGALAAALYLVSGVRVVTWYTF